MKVIEVLICASYRLTFAKVKLEFVHLDYSIGDDETGLDVLKHLK